jgi:predicted heme/steroid binding protein
VAVDGIVYDVSMIKQWSGGTHEGYEAGTDLTDLMASAPHSAEVLSKATVVGILVP